jgi:hypothetical protein
VRFEGIEGDRGPTPDGLKLAYRRITAELLAAKLANAQLREIMEMIAEHNDPEAGETDFFNTGAWAQEALAAPPPALEELRELVAAVTAWRRKWEAFRSGCEEPDCAACRVDRAHDALLNAYPSLGRK